MALLAPVSIVPSALVAVVVITAPAWACLLCFTTYSERLRICQIFVGMEEPALEKCEDAFTATFKGLRDMEINYDERGRLHDIFTQMTHSLQETAAAQSPRVVQMVKPSTTNRKLGSSNPPIWHLRRRPGSLLPKVTPIPGWCKWLSAWLLTKSWRFKFTQRYLGRKAWRPASTKSAIENPVEHRSPLTHLHGSSAKGLYYMDPLYPVDSYEEAFRAAAEAMKEDIAQLKEGRQEVSRRFRCRGCYSTLCNLPLDCPVQDVKVIRGDQAMFFCNVNFELPKEITYSWKFVGGGLRTQDQTYFRELPEARGNVARIRPAQPKHRGTFSCEIVHEERPLARLYFFLNGSGRARPRGAGLSGGARPADLRASVTGPPPRGETELQVSFREVVRWAPRETEMIEPWRPSLGELLASPGALTPSNLCLLAASAAFLSASLILFGWMFFRWYFSGS
ncbi:LOW QUALITY PROTEIN: sperm acrosome membrane-associated protein 6 [Trichechus inunguis]